MLKLDPHQHVTYTHRSNKYKNKSNFLLVKFSVLKKLNVY
jgi:hypothetical protein